MAYNPNFNPNCGACGGLNSRGYCQYTACRFPVSKETVITKPVSGTLIKPKPKTNADRLRDMSDEELAEFMCHNVSNGTVNCAFCGAQEFCRMGHNGWLDWLRQEVSDA